MPHHGSFICIQLTQYLFSESRYSYEIKIWSVETKNIFLYSWDRIVPETYVLKNTDENKQLMKKLADTTKK